eukprot:10336166-Alexandrium_andersonii.AAC.1
MHTARHKATHRPTRPATTPTSKPPTPTQVRGCMRKAACADAQRQHALAVRCRVCSALGPKSHASLHVHERPLARTRAHKH